MKASGIPFGASITLRKFTGKAPEGTYFAGWSIENPTGDNLDAIQTQAPGDSVGYRKLRITADKQVVTLYAVYKSEDVATVDFAVNNSNWGFVDVSSGSFTVAGDTVSGANICSMATARAGYHLSDARRGRGNNDRKQRQLDRYCGDDEE